LEVGSTLSASQRDGEIHPELASISSAFLSAMQSKRKTRGEIEAVMEANRLFRK
jgi:hypothetical protein